MQAPAHFVVGAVICRYTRSKPLGLALAFVSHFALDALPHFEDWSILPHWLAPAVGRAWNEILVVLASGLVILPWLLWRRYRDDPRGMVWVAYLVVGGFMGCLPDGLTLLLGHHSLIGRLNNGAHMTWTPTYDYVIRHRHDLRPLVSVICLASEWIVFAVGCWLLFRKRGGAKGTGHEAHAPSSL